MIEKTHLLFLIICQNWTYITAKQKCNYINYLDNILKRKTYPGEQNLTLKNTYTSYLQLIC